MRDRPKEPHGHTDQKSEEKMKKYRYLTDLLAKKSVIKRLTIFIELKRVFLLIKFQYTLNLSSELRSASQCGSPEPPHIELW